VHDGSETVSDAFTFNISDGSLNDGPATLNITITPVNDAPSITTNNGLTLNEGGTQQLTTAQLNIGDPDHAAANVTITVSGTADNGFLALTGNLGVPITSFTLAQLQNGDVYYIHDGSETTTDQFSFTASDGALASTATNFDLTITPVNDGPVVTVGSNIAVNEGGNTTLTTTHISVADPDHTAANLTITLGTPPTNGFIALAASPTVSITNFTFAQLQNGDVIYVHDSSETASDSFTFTASDGALTTGLSTSNIDVTAINDSVQLVQNVTGTVAEGARTTITNILLSTTDSDDAATDITYVATSLAHGHIEVNGTQTTTFTQDDINNGRVEFVHDGGELSNAHFDFSVADGLEQGATASTAQFQMNVTAVNDTPTNLWIDGDIISERGAIGEEIGTLYADDVDNVHADMTFTILNDSDGKFDIVGDKLVLNSTLNFTTAAFHDVTIRVTDLAGAFFDQTLTIDVEDVADAFVNLPTDPNRASDPRPVLEEDDRTVSVSDAENSLLQGLVNKNYDDQNGIFYGDGLSDINRNNTTLFIRDFVGDSLNLFGDQTENNGENQQTSLRNTLTLSDPDELMEINDTLNLRQGPNMSDGLSLQEFLLAKAKERDGNNGTDQNDESTNDLNENDDGTMPSIKTVEELFDDIKGYQDARAQKLWEALSSNNGA
jgi:hypothetical protein